MKTINKNFTRREKIRIEPLIEFTANLYILEAEGVDRIVFPMSKKIKNEIGTICITRGKSKVKKSKGKFNKKLKEYSDLKSKIIEEWFDNVVPKNPRCFEISAVLLIFEIDNEGLLKKDGSWADEEIFKEIIRIVKDYKKDLSTFVEKNYLPIDSKNLWKNK